MKNNFGFFLGIVILSWLIVGIPYIIATLLVNYTWGLSLFFHIISMIASMTIQIGMIKIALMFVDNKKPELNDLFNSFPHFFWKYLGASILYGLIIVGGILLLVIPGIVWAIKFQYFNYLIVDKNLGVTDALKKSSQITNGVKWPLFGFGFLLVLINYGGAILLFIGLLVTIPITMIANAYVYRTLQKQIDTIQTPDAAVTT